MLTNVRRVIRFRQEAWMAPYIAENTRLRQAAVDKFEKDYYKLLNNALFGKTMENVRKRVKIVLVNKGRFHAFDFSNLPEDHPLFSTENKAVIGKFKDEAEGWIIIEFIGEFFYKLYSCFFCFFFLNLFKKLYT